MDKHTARLKDELLHLMTTLIATEPALGPNLIQMTYIEAMDWSRDFVQYEQSWAG